jgi:putrescine transport system substrate-binding protein
MKSSRTFERIASLLLAATLSAFAPAARAQAEEKVLNIYNWSDYIADDIVANFEKESGIKVRYDVYDSNETLNAKLNAGHSGYDIVVPSSYWAAVQLDGGKLRKIDKARVPNLKNLDPVLQGVLANVDPGNQYLVTWLWGYTTVGINVDKVKAALGATPMPANAWDLVFKPEYASKLKNCGISFLDSATEIIPAALHYAGKPIFSTDKADYQAIAPLLKAIRPDVSVFSSSGYIDDLANGSLCVALGWSGDINIARRRAIEGKTGQDIRALIPANGGILALDAMAIPADAPHPGNAMKWMDYILRPEVSARLTNKITYANANKESRKFVNPDIADNPSIFLSAADIRNLKDGAMPLSIRRTMTSLYASFKSGI